MYLGIGVHKRYVQVAVIDEAGEVVEGVRVKNANLDDLAHLMDDRIKLLRFVASLERPLRF